MNDMFEVIEIFAAHKREKEALAIRRAPFEEFKALSERTFELLKPYMSTPRDPNYEMTEADLQKLKSLYANSDDPDVAEAHQEFWKLMDSVSS